MDIKYKTFEICTDVQLPNNADHLWISSSNPLFKKMKTLAMAAAKEYMDSPDNPTGSKPMGRRSLQGGCSGDYVLYYDVGVYATAVASGALFMGSV